MKISTCNEHFTDWPIEKVFQYCSRLGFDGVEIAPFMLGSFVTEVSSYGGATYAVLPGKAALRSSVSTGCSEDLMASM